MRKLVCYYPKVVVYIATYSHIFTIPLRALPNKYSNGICCLCLELGRLVICSLRNSDSPSRTLALFVFLYPVSSITPPFPIGLSRVQGTASSPP